MSTISTNLEGSLSVTHECVPLSFVRDKRKPIGLRPCGYRLALNVFVENVRLLSPGNAS